MLYGIHKSHILHKKCYEVYGFDILLDDNLNAWLMEVNISPSLTTDSPLDDMIKTRLISDTINLIGLKVETPETINEKEELIGRISNRNYKKLENLNWDNCIDKLNPEDWEILFESEEEFYRRGHFELIFPLKENIEEYKKFFEFERYNNILLWKYKTLDKNILERITKLESTAKV